MILLDLKVIHTMETKDYEKIIKDYDSHLYEAIVNIIPLLPDDRPLETVSQMKGIVDSSGTKTIEPQNPWRILVEEISALSLYPFEIELLNSINDEDKNALEKYMKDQSSIPALSFNKYPLLTFLLSRMMNLNDLFLSYERTDLVNLENPLTREDVQYVRSDKVLDWILEKNPEITEDMALEYVVSYPGTTLLSIKTRLWTPEQLLLKSMEEGTLETIAIIRYIPDRPSFHHRHLHVALRSGNCDAVDFVLSSGEADPSYLKENILFYTIRESTSECLKRLLRDPIIKDMIKPGCLAYAIRNKRKEMVRILLQEPTLLKSLKDPIISNNIMNFLNKTDEEIKNLVLPYLSK